MKSSTKFSLISTIALLILHISLMIIQARPAYAAPLLPDLAPENQIEFRNPFLPPPNPWKSVEIKWPENYIEPTLRHGLNLVLPQTIRNSLQVDAGYDRLQGLPTFKADYFLPIKAWNDKSLFLDPRFSLDAKNETFSIGGGFRHLVTSETMIGFHAFHDWTRQRGIRGEFLKETGVGFELSALPGKYSDISVRVNTYIPVNERRSFSEDPSMVVKEKLPVGVDAKLAFLLPAMVNWLDVRMDATFHSYRGERVDLTGYKAGISASTRDGMLRASFQHETDTLRGDNFQVEGSINLTFDWNEALKGKLPFSAPYKVSDFRFERKMHDGLYDRFTRRHDFPTDRAERRTALETRVTARTVSFDGGFPDLPNSRLTVQISQSPWRDAAAVTTDASGAYKGKIDLPPGKYKFRLVHKGTGRMSAEKTLVVAGDGAAR
jgi:hypothetical protein